MKIKVYCPCGARFEFEVEPVHERMPVPINCPTCGQDATGLANDVIRQQLATPGAPAADVPVKPSPPPPPSPAPSAPAAPVAPSAGLRISRAAPAPAASAESSAPAAAPRPVPQRPVPAAIPVRQKAPSEDELNPMTKKLIMGVVAVLFLLGAAWFWYIWFGRDPKTVYSLDFPKTNPQTGKVIVYHSDTFFELIAPARLLTIKNRQVSLMDVGQEVPLWSVPVPAGAEDSYESPHVVTTTNDIWIAWRDRLLCVDLQTGTQKSLSIPDPVASITAGDHMILVLSGKSSSNQVVTQFSLPGGATQTEEIASQVQSNAPAKPAANPVVVKTSTGSALAARDTSGLKGMERLKNMPSQALDKESLDELAFDRFDSEPAPLFDAGVNAIWFQKQLLEHRVISREAMKKASGKSVLDNPNVNASQGLELAEEMMNNAQRERTGGVDYIDVSRYQVTLHRLFAHDVPDWTGEVVGPPELIPLKTVDLLLAGTNILVFDKSNKKLWDAKLTYPYASGYGFRFEHTGPPCLETADALYFADKGMLTRFDPATGNVRWRLTSVGISSVQVDERGRLYVDTTTLQAGAIQYSQQISLRDRDLRVIMQVDSASGNILWRSDFPGSDYHCLISGKFLYSYRIWQTQDPLRFEEGPDTHFTFKLHERDNGKMVWNHVLDNKQLIKAEVQKNWILLQFDDRVSVMKFFSL